jgi:hypothetical protein
MDTMKCGDDFPSHPSKSPDPSPVSSHPHPNRQATVPRDYNNPCSVCNNTFCSQECEDSYVRVTGTPLATTQMPTVDIQYETSEHPMSKDLYDTLSNVHGFTNMNGATYTSYVANWEIRRQSGCLHN